MNRFDAIRAELEDIRDREVIRLFRLSRRAADRGCSDRLCVQIRNEAWCLQRMEPEILLYPFHNWKFAFNRGREFQ